MKKTCSLILSVMMIAVLLAACGPPDTPGNQEGTAEQDTDAAEKKKPEKLVIWEDDEKGAWLNEALKGFEEEYGIEVEYMEIPMADKMRERLRLDAPAGTGPDILTLPHDQIGSLATEGLLEPLRIDQAVLDRFNRSSLAAQTYNGTLYGLPKATETPVLIYNKAYVKEPPATFEELYQRSKALREDGKYGFLALWDNYYFAHAVVAAYGGYVFQQEDGTFDPDDIGLNNAHAVEAVKYIEKWYEEDIFPAGIIGESGGSAKDGLWEDHQAAAIMDGPWAYNSSEQAGIDFGVAPLPKLPNGEYPKTFIGVKGWHISSYSEHKEWAVKLLEYLTTEESFKIRYQQTQEIPPVKALIEDPLIADNPRAKAVAVQSQRGEPMPNIPEMTQVWGPMASALQLVASGKQDPQAALDEAVEQIRQKIAAMK